MGPRATLALTDSMVRESIMTGTHFLGCKSCGTYDRHNEIVQVVAFAWFKYELKYSGSTGSFDSNYVGIVHLCERQQQTHRWTGLGECPIPGKSGL